MSVVMTVKSLDEQNEDLRKMVKLYQAEIGGLIAGTKTLTKQRDARPDISPEMAYGWVLFEEDVAHFRDSTMFHRVEDAIREHALKYQPK